jgi:predicted nucleic acid-binding protein
VFTALLDTSVLWPSLQRDFLLSLAIEGTYRAVWSSAILEELQEHESLKLQDRGTPRAESDVRAARLVAQMQAIFPDSQVQHWESLEGRFGLPDPDDEHVAAAAVIGGAGVIVTHNLRDFPADLLPNHLDVLPPSEFLLNTVSLDSERSLAAVQAISNRSGRHGEAWTVGQVLDLLQSRYGLGEAVDLMRAIA